MTKIVFGDRIGKSGKISVGCSAVVFNKTKKKILLARRTDNGQWCLPGGRVEPGESVTETCLRELQEETGLKGEIVKLIGVYSNPNQIIKYPDGNRMHLVALCFEVEVISGTLVTSDETSEFGYFRLDEISSIDLLPNHHERIADAFLEKTQTFVR
jgi:ADP-ribose pyrophosphatase YjhB (NUDIX family)